MIRSRLCIVTCLHAVFLLLFTTVSAAPAAVLYDNDGTIWLLDALADGKALVYHGPVADAPAQLLVTNVHGAFRIDVVEEGIRVIPFDEELVLSPLEREAVLEDVAALLDASWSDWRGDPPPLLLKVHRAVADRKPDPVVLYPDDLPVLTRGCSGDSRWREQCDNCCEARWREDRDECREKLKDDSQASLHKCLQYAAISLATCTARCTFLPVKPVDGGGGNSNSR